VIHTVKAFGIDNKAEIDVFLELFYFLDDPAEVGNLISGSSAFSKSNLNTWKFLKKWEYQTTWSASWEICMQVKKQQLQLDMEQHTGSKSGKAYIKEIQPVHPKGNQPWIFIGRTDAKAEIPILWPPDAKNCLIWKDLDSGKDWRLEE